MKYFKVISPGNMYQYNINYYTSNNLPKTLDIFHLIKEITLEEYNNGEF